MREIKFRYTVIRKNGFVFNKIFTIDEIENGAVSIWIEANYIDVVDMKRDQYSGLKDKNGKEIYEGDILKSSHCGNGIVKFKAGKYYLDLRDGILFISDTHEIIGNIHENPELLND